MSSRKNMLEMQFCSDMGNFSKHATVVTEASYLSSSNGLFRKGRVAKAFCISHNLSKIKDSSSRVFVMLG